MDVNLEKEKLKLLCEDSEKRELDQVQLQMNSLAISEKEFLSQLEYGNIQYNLDLSKQNKIDWEKLVNQMAFRLEEGNGECFYELGLGEGGEKIGLREEDLKESVENLEKIAFKLQANLQIIKFYRGKFGLVAEILIRKNSFMNKNIKKILKYDNYEIKIGLFGEETSGKSTLVGVLVNGNFDNGEGSARQNIFRFQHEQQCGKTSSISHQIIGFDQNGNILNSQNWEEIIQNSSKLINFYDLGGSEKASKTTLSALSPHYIDYFFLVISAKQGITENTKLFLILANSMNLPIISIITMTDLVNQGDIEELIKNYKFLIKNLKIKKLPLVVSSLNDIDLFSRNLNENIHPIFLLSNKNGLGFNFLINFLSLLPTFNSVLSSNFETIYLNKVDNLCQFDIHEHFMLDKAEKENTGKLIVGGIVSRGKIILGEKYYLGPDKNGNFKIVEVADIHCKKNSTIIAYKGQFSSLSLIKTETLNGLKYEDVRKGMSLLDINSSLPFACKSFVAEIWSIDGLSRTVKNKYEPVVTIKHVRQSCKIKLVENKEIKQSNKINSDDSFGNYMELETDYDLSSSKDRRKKRSEKNTPVDENITISPDEKIILNFEFKNYPEYITPRSHLIINDGVLKVFGIILRTNK